MAKPTTAAPVSFFGGDPAIAHFSVSVPFTLSRGSAEERKAERDARNADRDTLKAAGIKTQSYYQFRVSDKAGKARAEKLAKAEAARIEKVSGVAMRVYEGAFL